MTGLLNRRDSQLKMKEFQSHFKAHITVHPFKVQMESSQLWKGTTATNDGAGLV